MTGTSLNRDGSDPFLGTVHVEAVRRSAFQPYPRLDPSLPLTTLHPIPTLRAILEGPHATET